MRWIFAFLITLAAAANAQTSSGALQDQEIAELRGQVLALQEQVAAIEHDHEHEHMEFGELHDQLATLSAAVSALSDVDADGLADLVAQVDDLEYLFDLHLSSSTSSTSIENLQKRDALHYMRISLLEIALDPSGLVLKCWDSGGVPDRDNSTCLCPAESIWFPDSDPDDGVLDAACRWVEGTPADEDPEPEPDPDPEPPVPDEPPVDICEPTGTNPGENQGVLCTWDTSTCAWVCP